MMSTTDPDAVVIRHGRKESRPRYKTHRAVDDKHGVITATETTRSDVADGVKLMPLVKQHETNTGKSVETVVADATYGTVSNFRECHERGIRSHMADLHLKNRRSSYKGIFGEEAFTYDPETDTYVCPAGQRLVRRKHKKVRRVYEYTAGPKVCGACPLKKQCTRSRARTIRRHENHEAIEAARAQSHSTGAKRDRLRRRHLMEGSFADAANNHHFKRSRWRRLARQRIQDYLIAAVQNIEILLRHLRETATGASALAKNPIAATQSFFLRACKAMRVLLLGDSGSPQTPCVELQGLR